LRVHAQEAIPDEAKCAATNLQGVTRTHAKVSLNILGSTGYERIALGQSTGMKQSSHAPSRCETYIASK
jgi:hypothetical protein